MHFVVNLNNFVWFGAANFFSSSQATKKETRFAFRVIRLLNENFLMSALTNPANKR